MKIAIALVFAATGTAAADPGPGPLPSILPNRCVPLAQIPRSTSTDPAFSAHLSVAACMFEVALAEIGPTADPTSVERMNGAAAPALALYDDVIRTGSPYWQLIAQDAKRDLYTGMVVRMRASSPGRDVEALVGPWKSDADQADLAVNELARKNPQLATRDTVIAHVFERISQERTARR